MPNEPVRAGQPLLPLLTAARIQSWDEASGFRPRGAGGLFDPASAAFPGGQFIRVRNTTGSDRARFDVVGLDAAIITPTDNEAEFHRLPALDLVEPEWPLHYSRYAILHEPLADGKIGKALLSGVTSCKVNFADSNAATGHEYATVKHANYGYLESAACGVARVLWKESGTGQKWCKLLLGAPSPAGFWVRTPEGGIPATSETDFPYSIGAELCDVGQWDDGNIDDAGWQLLVYNSTGGIIAANKLIYCTFDHVGRAVAVVEWCAGA